MTVYIAVMHTGTLPANIVRLMTRRTYSHVGYSPSQTLAPLYSFGRRYPRLPYPGGFISAGLGGVFFNARPYTKLLVYECEITQAQKDLIDARLEPFLQDPKAYPYGLTNCFAQKAGVAREFKNRYTCSQFVAYLFEDILPFGKHPSLVFPMDFCALNLPCVFDGTVREYEKTLTQKQKEGTHP